MPFSMAFWLGKCAVLVAVLWAGAIVEAAGQTLQPAEPLPPPVSMDGLPGPVPADPGEALSPRRGPVALLLPLTGRQQALGQAVRDGFIAAHLAAGSPADVEIIVLDETAGAANGYQAALAAGASVLVGPLLKESAQSLSAVTMGLPVLALNYLPDGMLPVAGFYQFGLAPEDETTAIARRALALGQRQALVLSPSNEWGRRLQAAFTREFIAGGGEILAARSYDPASADFSLPIQDVLGTAAGRERHKRLQAIVGENLDFAAGPRADADLLFLAANTGAARQIRPQLVFFGAGPLPLYSTSAIYEDGAAADTDLDGIQFPDSPWVIAPDANSRAVKESLRQTGPAGALAVSRLYALGFDAYALAPRVRDGSMAGLALAGVTGELSTALDGRVHRALVWAEIRGGRPSGLTAVAAPAAGWPETSGPPTGDTARREPPLPPGDSFP